MARSLPPIPPGVAITDGDGIITIFFRLLWQGLVDGYTVVPLIGSLSDTGKNAALVTSAVYTALQGGLYRVSWYLRKTTADGVSSSLTLTIGWTESAVPLTEAQAAIAADSVTTGEQSGSKVIRVDANSNITAAIAYASNTAGNMKYRYDVLVEQLA